MAPHLIRPTRFLLPLLPGRRPALLLRFGLLLYDLLGARRLLPKSRTVDLAHNQLAQPLKRWFRTGFEFSDCLVDDSRLVVLNAMDAAERGAVICTRTRLARAERNRDRELALIRHGRRQIKTARVLINAAGPWIGEVADTVLRQPLPAPVRLVKGSHIVVRRRFDHDCGYLLQAADRRGVFALPFANEFTLIGTTDENFVGDLSSPMPDPAEINYLCDTVSQYFRDAVLPDELLWSFAGVRALYDDGAGKPEDVTRDYRLVLDERPPQAPLLTVYGGKITTHRKLAEAAMAMIGDFFPRMPPPWTRDSRLPGGDFPVDGFDILVAETIAWWPFLSESHARRLARAYGRRIERVLGSAQRMEDLGIRFAGDLTAAEVRYLVEQEWAETADDVLYRRSKLALTATPEEVTALGQFIASLDNPRARQAAI
jgi:glycerol-3-phosphate dehydrogenase